MSHLQGRESIVPCCRGPWIVTALPAPAFTASCVPVEEPSTVSNADAPCVIPFHRQASRLFRRWFREKGKNGAQAKPGAPRKHGVGKSPTYRWQGLRHKLGRFGLPSGNAKLIGHSHHLDQRLRSHLAQRLAAVDLHRHLAQLELMCNLLVWASGNDEREDFSFA